MSIDTQELGLRERKRLATRRAIQLAAIGLVAEAGLDRLTVDEIGRVADISPRTFFNYFPTKEAALVGDAPALPEGDSIQRFIEAGPGESIFRGIATLLSEASDVAAADPELTQSRRRVLKSHPELFAMRITSMHVFEQQLQDVVQQRLERDEPDLEPAARREKAALIRQVSFGVMRHAWVCWADAAGSNLATRLHTSFDELEALFGPPAVE